jgi:hypothetical protein
MALNFRPVIEKWGTYQSCFVRAEEVESIIDAFASEDMSKAGKVESNDYGELRSIWIEDGTKFLDYIASRTPEQHYEENSDLEFLNGDVKALLQNMVNAIPEWRTFLSEDGSLTFYIDQY